MALFLVLSFTTVEVEVTGMKHNVFDVVLYVGVAELQDVEVLFEEDWVLI
jgi:hypothetical protein